MIKVANEDRLIAEFNGQGINLHLVEDPITGEYVEPEFSSSWDWLMPVVEKIDEILPDDNFVSITYNRCLIEYFTEGVTIEGLGDSRLEATYNAVMEFILWYNEHK